MRRERARRAARGGARTGRLRSRHTPQSQPKAKRRSSGRSPGPGSPAAVVAACREARSDPRRGGLRVHLPRRREERRQNPASALLLELIYTLLFIRSVTIDRFAYNRWQRRAERRQRAAQLRALTPTARPGRRGSALRPSRREQQEPTGRRCRIVTECRSSGSEVKSVPTRIDGLVACRDARRPRRSTRRSADSLTLCSPRRSPGCSSMSTARSAPSPRMQHDGRPAHRSASRPREASTGARAAPFPHLPER
jgi:hypothetical protein